WISSATDPNLGGVNNFRALSTRSGLLTKLGKTQDAEKFMSQAMDNGTAIELHQYGRQLLGQKKYAEALVVFVKNFKKNNGAWPTNVGLMRGYSATGDLKKALEHARLALPQAPDDINKRNIEASIKTLENGKSI
ncbi:MAG: tetratricopeptide repeat protein, partial [Saprospiraceae bacterium]|nr:tetratricopeptide repeat protein [Saprospiraceae bacterium]